MATDMHVVLDTGGNLSQLFFGLASISIVAFAASIDRMNLAYGSAMEGVAYALATQEDQIVQGQLLNPSSHPSRR